MARFLIPQTYVGRKFCRLTVVEFLKVSLTPNGSRRYLFSTRCDCGGVKIARLDDLKSGKLKSCGCLSRESSKTVSLRHGHTANGALTPEWKVWRNMNTRATNKNIKKADRYTGRNIGVCDEWRNKSDGQGFIRFLDHVGQRPSPKHSLDRIDNDRGYEPGNVRWATRRQQATNKSNTVMIDYQGSNMPLCDAARLAGIPESIVYQRVHKLGWSAARALSVPPRPDRRRQLPCAYLPAEM